MLDCPIGGRLSGTYHILKKKPCFTCFAPGFLFCGEFSPPGDQKKKKTGESNRGILENFLKKFAISREKKELEVARFRQCVPLGRQN
jgi:hypothetical protein